MSVNYYLDSPDNEAGHLGKSYVTGFIARALDGVNSYDAWVAQMQDRRIFGEYGIEYSADELVALANERGRRHSLRYRSRADEGEFVEHGITFVRRWFC